MDKNLVLIVSGGRTGTGFFGDRLGGVIEDTFSVHEPDVMSLKPSDLNEKRKYFSLKYLLIDRLVKQNGIRQFSEKTLAGQINEKSLKEELIKNRYPYYNRIPESLIIESYYAWYGLIDQAFEIFPNLKMVGVIRDPRDWVTSNMNWEKHFGSKDYATLFGFNKLNPVLIKDNEYIDKWGAMSKFEKLCWMWKTINSQIMKLQKYEEGRIYKFEEVFKQGEEGKFDDLIHFITTWESRKYKTDVTKDILQRKSNVNISYTFPKWKEWDKSLAFSLQSICGDLGTKLGYCMEKEWLEKTAQPINN